MEKDDIILSFKGDITNDLLTSVYQIMETRLDSEQEEPRIKRKFYHILVECLQNLYHHMESMQKEEHEELAASDRTAIFMIGRDEKNGYRIFTGNFILNLNSEELKVKMDKINGMSAEELRAYYIDTLSTTELSDKGGAGLGMIDIARKSGHKMEYHFHKISEKFSFFSLCVTVK
jgi:hypothetical protein